MTEAEVRRVVDEILGRASQILCLSFIGPLGLRHDRKALRKIQCMRLFLEWLIVCVERQCLCVPGSRTTAAASSFLGGEPAVLDLFMEAFVEASAAWTHRRDHSDAVWTWLFRMLTTMSPDAWVRASILRWSWMFEQDGRKPAALVLEASAVRPEAFLVAGAAFFRACVCSCVSSVRLFPVAVVEANRPGVEEACGRHSGRRMLNNAPLESAFVLWMPEAWRTDRSFLTEAAARIDDGGASFAALPELLRGVCALLEADETLLVRTARRHGARFFRSAFGSRRADDRALAEAVLRGAERPVEQAAAQQMASPLEILESLSDRLRGCPRILGLVFSGRRCRDELLRAPQSSQAAYATAWASLPQSVGRDRELARELLAANGALLSCLGSELRASRRLILTAVRDHSPALLAADPGAWRMAVEEDASTTSPSPHKRRRSTSTSGSGAGAAAADGDDMDLGTFVAELLRLDLGLWQFVPATIRALCAELSACECSVCGGLGGLRGMRTCPQHPRHLVCRACAEQLLAHAAEESKAPSAVTCPVCRQVASTGNGVLYGVDACVEVGSLDAVLCRGTASVMLSGSPRLSTREKR